MSGIHKTIKKVTDDIRIMLATRYIDLAERITGMPFVLPQDPDVPTRIGKNLAADGGILVES